MGQLKITAVFQLLVFLAVLDKMESQRWLPPVVPSGTPLCGSQIALANYACRVLPNQTHHDDNANENMVRKNHHKHKHHHRRHKHKHKDRDHDDDERRPLPEPYPVPNVRPPTADEENCCRWVKEIDDECVCNLLAHLPSFLARPVHSFTVIVHESCVVNYSCGSRLKN
ncbi:hypothetical protein ACFE04_012038 [Oxalis oulophora]